MHPPWRADWHGTVAVSTRSLRRVIVMATCRLNACRAHRLDHTDLIIFFAVGNADIPLPESVAICLRTYNPQW